MFFLGTGMLVMVIGLSTVMMVRIQRRGNEGSNDVAAARFYAQSAIEYGFALINANPLEWQNLGSGTWLTNQPIGTGTFSLGAIIQLGGEEGDTVKQVAMTGIGVQGQATHGIEVTLAPVSDARGLVISPGSWQRYGGGIVEGVPVEGGEKD